MANITGTAGNDSLTGLDGNDVIDGGAGYDTVTISDGSGTVTINLVLGTSQGTVRSGLDMVSNIERYNVFAGVIDFTGDANDNFIQASANVATLRGGAGNDTYLIQNANAVIIEAANEGIDRVVAQSSYILPVNVENGSFEFFTTGNFDLTGNDSANELRGNNGANTLMGGNGDDTLFGDNGNDILNGGAGNDRLDGGNGDDTYIIDSTGDIITFDQTGNDTVIASANFALSSSLAIETLRATAGAAITLTGSSIAQTLIGSEANNRLNGLGGNDVLEGGAGADILDGGAGIDGATYANATGAVFVDLGGYALESSDTTGLFGASSITVSQDTLIAIENVIGSNFGDRIYGDANNNILGGGNGSDILYGGNGLDTVSFMTNSGAVFADFFGRYALETTTTTGTVMASDVIVSTDYYFEFENIIGSRFGDRIYGNTTDNVLSGFGGSDILYGDAGSDTVSFAFNEGAVYVDFFGRYALETSTITGTVLASDVIVSTDYFFEFENITGSRFGDRIYGNDADNILSGLGGSDILYAGGGNDTISFADNIGAVSASIADSTAFETNESFFAAGFTVSTDYFFEFENLIGSEFNDVLTGSSGVNRINGGAGNDVINGGLGNDILTGGAGSDRFYIDNNSVDNITDFVSLTDDIYILRSVFGFSAGTNGVTIVNNGPAISPNSFIFDTATQTLSFDADGAGGNAAVQVATFGGVATLTSSDFVLYG
jgi:Ca2+-binding RTX toxin-like protein